MPWMDWLVLGVAAAGAYRGAKVGMLRQAISILGWLFAFILALQLMQPVGELLVVSLPIDRTMAPLVGFVIVLGTIRIVVFVLRQAVESLLEAFHLTLLNRLGGILFGTFQGILIASLLFLVLGYVGVPPPEKRQASVLYEPVAAALPETWDAAARHFPRVRTAAEQFGRHVEEELPARSR